eukprot:TRINITY_DN2469_c0_g1_i1.p1 TRINITY_DN2469_c0_g1~~TRINITY_DN2469_c0_g1_i1.p1  ORF type:complete len:435 (-),score=49.14 TRINITY_DN2469_c0_g1_i1:80-1384(-)
MKQIRRRLWTSSKGYSTSSRQRLTKYGSNTRCNDYRFVAPKATTTFVQRQLFSTSTLKRDDDHETTLYEHDFKLKKLNPKRSHILIIYTGGTVGMKKGENGSLKPEPGFLSTQLSMCPEISDPLVPTYDIIEFTPPLDSSDILPAEWESIARYVEKSYYDYDGFLVLHGTDTMSYTASALSFMFENLAKPVVITGSQIPINNVINDARRNLISSMVIAGSLEICEVVILFNGKIFRGNRTTKIDNWGLAAFASPNYPDLGRFGIDLELSTQLWLKPPKKRFQVNYGFDTNVAILHLFPGMSTEIISNLLLPPTKGLILNTFGTGNAPKRQEELVKQLKKAVARDVIVVVTTQCLKGTVDLNAYDTGTTLERIGCTGGFDLTTEAAVAKLMHLLKQDIETHQIKSLMTKSLKGELTEDIDRGKRSNKVAATVIDL